MAKFEGGNTAGQGKKGKRSPGSGKPKDEFVEWCQNLATSEEARNFITALLKGEAIQEKVIDTPGHEAQMLMVAASPEVRLKAWIHVSERGFGKIAQDIKNVDDDGKAIPYSITVKIESPING